MLREKIYELKNWKLAVHTTWNPGAENVMRIHLVPPRFLSGKIVPSVVILNGQEIVPVSEAWAILLTEFIRRINQYENHAIEEKDESLASLLVSRQCGNKVRVFHFFIDIADKRTSCQMAACHFINRSFDFVVRQRI